MIWCSSPGFGFRQSQPSLSADGKTLYFVKGIKGEGKSNSDIYVSQLQNDGLWGPPQRLPDHINTTNTEESVHIHPDGRTLYFASKGHPWTTELSKALKSYRRLQKADLDSTEWLEELKLRTNYWCAQVLAGAFPFPPKLKPRSEDMEELKQRLPGLNENNSY